MYFIYVLLSEKDNKFYIGQTTNVNKRLKQHNQGKVSSTKNRTPFKLIYQEAVETRVKAREREKFFKSGFGREILKTSFC